MKYFVARQHLSHTRVWLAAFFDGGKEFSVLQLNAVHRYIHFGHVNLLFLAGLQIIIASQVSASIADVSEISSQGAVVVE